MTGCYKFVGRDCMPPEGRVATGDCVHCGCPITERSTYKNERWTCVGARHAKKFEEANARFSTKSDIYRTEMSRRVEAHGKKKQRIKEALAETRAATAK